jgi:hypothetical protein
MKALGVFHKLLREGKPSLTEYIQYRSQIFNLRGFKDTSSPEGMLHVLLLSYKGTAHYQSIFVQKYGQYLEEKVIVYKVLKIEFEKNPEITTTFSMYECIEKIPRLQSQLNALLNCRVEFYRS